MIYEKLKILQQIQNKFPSAHVGGSIGLFLRGIDLGRDLSNSDLDLTIDKEPFFDIKKTEKAESSDFDFSITFEDTKIDFKISDSSFDIILFENFSYNVSKLDDIIFWKKIYASKGVEKHIKDLEKMKIDFILPF